MRALRPILITSLFLLALLAAARGALTRQQLQPGAIADPSFKVGALLCLTGECAEWGTESLNGLRLAAEELNAEGGVLGRKIELVIEDSREIAVRDAVNAYHRLLTVEDIHYIVGPTWTPAGLAIAPLARRNENIVITSPSLGVKDFNEAGPNIFNLWPHDERGTRALAGYAIRKGWRRAAVFSSEQQWSKAQGDIFVQAFTDSGGTIAGLVEPQESNRDLRSEALSLLRSDPELIMFSAFGEQAALGARQLRSLGYSGPMLIVLMDESTLSAAGGALEGAVFTRYPTASEEFRRSYQITYGKEPGTSADTAYDTLYMYARAIEAAGTFNPSSVAAVLNQGTSFTGASGEVTLDAEGGVTKRPQLTAVRGTSFVPLAAD